MSDPKNVWDWDEGGWAGAVVLEGREGPAPPHLCDIWSESFQRLERYALWLEDQILGAPQPDPRSELRKLGRLFERD